MNSFVILIVQPSSGRRMWTWKLKHWHLNLMHDRNLIACKISEIACTSYSQFNEEFYNLNCVRYGGFINYGVAGAAAAEVNDLEENAPGGLPKKNDGGARRTFQGSKFVDWYRFECCNIKVILVPFRVLSKKWQELCVSPLIFISKFSFMWNIGFSRRTPGTC